MLQVNLMGEAHPGFSINVDFAVQEGTCIGVFGPSGSGKSTLLRSIAGLLTVPGAIHCDGVAWQEGDQYLAPHERRAATVFQTPSLLPNQTVRRNIERAQRFGPNQHQASVAALAAQFELTDFMDRPAAALSGGQQQRVALARALAACPPVLLLDEPLTGLDSDARRRIMQVLMRLQRAGQTMVFVSHSATAHALLTNHLLVLENGQQQLADTTQSVFENAGAPPALSRQAGVMLREAHVTHNSKGLAQVQHDGLTFHVACPSPPGTVLNLRIRADDVSLAPPEAVPTSIMNSVAASIRGINLVPNDAMALVSLDCSGQRLLSRVTRNALERLGLEVGSTAMAQIKSAAIDWFPVDEDRIQDD